MFTKYGEMVVTFYFGDIDLIISSDRAPSIHLRSAPGNMIIPITRVRPWPIPDNPNVIITDEGRYIPMTATEYEHYLERLLDELSGDRCFEWIDRVEEAEEI